MAPTKLRESIMDKPVEGDDFKEPKGIGPVDVDTLVVEYDQLTQRKEDLQVKRDEITAKLDRGEIEADSFRKELMNIIQEAAMVSEKLQVTAANLTSLGYRGIR